METDSFKIFNLERHDTKDIIDNQNKEDAKAKKDWFWENAPLFEVLLDSVIPHLPSPIEAQKYRIPKIWSGDLDSEFGKQLLACDPNGEPAFVITNTIIDAKSGKEISAGKLLWLLAR